MAQITIKLRFNKKTGKKDIVIEYESEEDATGWEHEKRHKRIVEDLIGKGVLEEGEFGQVVRERAGAGAGAAEAASPVSADAPEAEGQGS